jgi:predicted glycoside hydrolase/deacetylase ChbG (UPF0249 family)
MRLVIVNADDFGRSAGINRGVIEAHERGIVTSASLMVRWPDAEGAVALWRMHAGLDLGLHVDLGEWVHDGQRWSCTYEVIPPNDASAVAAEVDDQLVRFRELTGADPTHIDSHQHVHRREPARSALLAVSRRLGVPLRELNSPATYRGDFFGHTRTGGTLPDAIGEDALIALLASLPDGLTELGCHPAANADTDSTYGEERVRELAALCQPAVWQAVTANGLRLSSFGRLRAMHPVAAPAAQNPSQ